MKTAARQRWALSFADLCLLLLGFFVMLQANPDPARLSAGFRTAFGVRDNVAFQDRAPALFEPGEAILRPQARDRITSFVQDHPGGALIVSSKGTDPAAARFDGWELAAARTAAMARALQQSGIPQDRIAIAIDPATGGGQTIQISAR
ncbi:flagellar motor protein MotB [uncultured Sphingomonas sp.]|uniref:flagellar motor protein MotB n=1 Tax=uncultured Sphingomonas sp. TaxID=158754 RepID=UPI0026010BA5|nr:flagellar motor protein MotB [uncultured Sphingomonas sp.]